MRHHFKPLVSDLRSTANWQTQCHPRKEGRRKKKIQKKGDECEESKKAIENDVILGEEEKAELCQRADDQLKVLDQQESEFQTDNEKSQQLATTLSSINDKVSNGEGVVRKLQAQFGMESMALEDALEKVHKAEYRLERQQQKLEEEQQAHELLLKEQT